MVFPTTDFKQLFQIKTKPQKIQSLCNCVILGSLLKINHLIYSCVKISTCWKESVKSTNFIILLQVPREASDMQQLLQSFTSHMPRDWNWEKQLPNSGGSKRLTGLPEVKHFLKLKTGKEEEPWSYTPLERYAHKFLIRCWFTATRTNNPASTKWFLGFAKSYRALQESLELL